MDFHLKPGHSLSLLSESEKTSCVFVFKTYLIADVKGEKLILQKDLDV